MYILDNEASGIFKQALKKYNLTYQLAPPHIHRVNAAERAICTFKNHFLATMATADPEYPMSKWDRLLPQAELTLNLLRNARANPQLSAYAYLFGQFDFNKTPLAPAGTKVLVHEKPAQRRTWGYHGIDGWYVGPAMDHYRCMTCYIPSLASIRILDTVDFFPTQIKFPSVTKDDHIRQAITVLVTILSTRPTTLPEIQFGNNTENALHQIAGILQRAVPLPQPNAPKKDVDAHTPTPPLPLQPQQIAAAAAMVTNIPLLRVMDGEAPVNNVPLPRVEDQPDPKPIVETN